MIQQACILAAGRGTRLGEQGEQLPKGFLRLGERPIIEESLTRLARAGIRQVVIVTGHLAHFYQELADRVSLPLELVHNPLFAQSGSLYSLWLALERMQADFLLLESDLIYEQRALGILLQEAGPNQLLASGPSGSGDEVWVESSQGVLVNLSKQRDQLGPEILGEFVGINRLSRCLVQEQLGPAATRLLGADLQADYEAVLVACGAHLRCRLVTDLVWAEIDNDEHWERARRVVYPATLSH